MLAGDRERRLTLRRKVLTFTVSAPGLMIRLVNHTLHAILVCNQTIKLTTALNEKNAMAEIAICIEVVFVSVGCYS